MGEKMVWVLLLHDNVKCKPGETQNFPLGCSVGVRKARGVIDTKEGWGLDLLGPQS